MRYSIDYQYMPKGAERPLDEGEVVGIEISPRSGSVLIPEVGDYISIDNSLDDGGRASFSGRVHSRLYSYTRISQDEVVCSVNIVVAEDDEGWHRLIKE